MKKTILAMAMASVFSTGVMAEELNHNDNDVAIQVDKKATEEKRKDIMERIEILKTIISENGVIKSDDKIGLYFDEWVKIEELHDPLWGEFIYLKDDFGNIVRSDGKTWIGSVEVKPTFYIEIAEKYPSLAKAMKADFSRYPMDFFSLQSRFTKEALKTINESIESKDSNYINKPVVTNAMSKVIDSGNYTVSDKKYKMIYTGYIIDPKKSNKDNGNGDRVIFLDDNERIIYRLQTKGAERATYSIDEWTNPTVANGLNLIENFKAAFPVGEAFEINKMSENGKYSYRLNGSESHKDIMRAIKEVKGG